MTGTSTEGLMNLVSEYGHAKWSEGVTDGGHIDSSKHLAEEAADLLNEVRAYAERLCSPKEGEADALAVLTDAQIKDAVFAVLRRWHDDRAWDRYTRESGPYDVTNLRPEVLEIIRAVLDRARALAAKGEMKHG